MISEGINRMTSYLITAHSKERRGYGINIFKINRKKKKGLGDDFNKWTGNNICVYGIHDA